MLSVLQIIDTLQAGGAERMAINYANGITQFNVTSHLCTTRKEGPLLGDLKKDVGYVFLGRRRLIDIKAFFKLRRYILKHKIKIVHAHASSFFIATILKILLPQLKLIWHDHYGNSEILDKRPKRILQFCSLFFSYIFCVNYRLKSWSSKHLYCKNVQQIRNFSVLNPKTTSVTKLEGKSGKRILCMANLREQKNQMSLLKAFQEIIDLNPEWTLHLVGKDFEDKYSKNVFIMIEELRLGKYVYFYGSRPDVLNIMSQCQIGILVSKSEGLPLALLEYGIAGLSVISTNVGECAKLIPNSSHGILLNNDSPKVIAKAIQKLIENRLFREETARNFQNHVKNQYSEHAVLTKVVETYNRV
ncbi:glycosyltransferase [Winogradskyella sp. DF17]|uniref:Glycosyltransferase n=1 Tax=Winogradskyella pelagia TaxID=2819984 RepID=A0ABS3T4M1_9FLAO|nr:glycosyltransferase [Winogradskyella sp. DF17]MBO3116680.1 glycosyltransferase [Winogradskyella sp. DF17]